MLILVTLLFIGSKHDLLLGRRSKFRCIQASPCKDSRFLVAFRGWHEGTGMCTSITAGADNEQVRWNVPGDPHRLALSVLTQQHAHTKLGNSHSCMLLCRAPIPSNGQFPECGLCILSFQLPDLCHQTCCSNKQTVMKKNCSNNNVLKQIKRNWAHVSQECRGK